MKSIFSILIVLVFFGCNKNDDDISINSNNSKSGTLKIYFEGKNAYMFHGQLTAQYSGKVKTYNIGPANYAKIERSEYPVQGNQTIKLKAEVMNENDNPIANGEYILRVEFDGKLLKEQIEYGSPDEMSVYLPLK